MRRLTHNQGIIILLKAPWFHVGSRSSLNIFHKNREISILMMKKKPTARWTLLQEATERSKIGKTKTKTKNSTTVGKGQWKTPTCELSFCCKSGSNRKTQPYCWLATDHNTAIRLKTDQQKWKSRTLKERTAGKKQRTPSSSKLDSTRRWVPWDCSGTERSHLDSDGISQVPKTMFVLILEQGLQRNRSKWLIVTPMVETRLLVIAFSSRHKETQGNC